MILNTPSWENSTGGSTLQLGDNGDWGLASGIGGGRISVNGDSLRFSLTSNEALIELQSGLIRTYVFDGTNSNLRDVLNGISRQFLGNDGNVRLQVDDAGVQVSGAYYLPATLGASGQVLTSDGANVVFSSPATQAAIRAPDAVAEMRCSDNGVFVMFNTTTLQPVFLSDPVPSSTVVTSPVGTAELTLPDAGDAVVKTPGNLFIDCTGGGTLKLNGYTSTRQRGGRRLALPYPLEVRSCQVSVSLSTAPTQQQVSWTASDRGFTCQRTAS
jgi:hypothetical protein